MQLFDNTVSPAIAEARVLHPESEGYFCVSEKTSAHKSGWKERMFPMSGLDAVVNTIRGKSDTYLSQATFRTKTRLSHNTQSLRCVFVDLDVYSAKGGGKVVNDELIQAIEDRAVELNIPKPSYISNSGRGAYVKWVFDTPVGKEKMIHWKLLQKKFVNAYRDLGSDSKVVDAARVLRLAETVNSKSGRTVEIVRQGEAYSFADLIRSASSLELYQESKTGKLLKMKEPTAIKNHQVFKIQDLAGDAHLTNLSELQFYSDQRTPILMKDMSIQSLNWNRFLDLRDLVVSRGGIPTGSRDITLFWMVNFLHFSGVINAGNFWNEVRGLLKSFPIGRDFDPMNDGSMTSMLKRIEAHARGEKILYQGCEYNPVYTPSNDLLLNLFEISSEEERGLRTMISAREKLHRADEKCPGRAERRQDRQELRFAAVALKEQGVKVIDIAKQLGRDRSTITRWLQPDAGAGKPFVETRGRRRSVRTPCMRLTSRGLVPMNKELTDHNPGPVGASNVVRSNGLTDHELRRRTRVRQEKPHLKRESMWSAERMDVWLLARRTAMAEQRALRESIPEATQEICENDPREIAYQASIKVLERIRKSSQDHISTQISIWTKPSVSSSPETGPPGNNSD